MGKKMIFIFILLYFSGLIFSDGINERKLRSGPYLGEKTPGITPHIFGADFISLKNVSEFSCTFSADSTEFYFARQIKPGKYSVFWTRQNKGVWTVPEVASFCGDYFNHEPYISPDNKTIYWGTVRPLFNGNSEYSIWTAQRCINGWSNLKPLGFQAMYITATKSGVLYYSSGGRGGSCIARAELKGNQYDLQILQEPVLSDYWDGHPCIAPDESFLIFDSENRPQQELCGLFISFRKKDGKWTEPQNMKSVMPKGRYAMFSPDYKYIFYAAPGRGKGKDLYWIDAEVIEKFRPEGL